MKLIKWSVGDVKGLQVSPARTFGSLFNILKYQFHERQVSVQTMTMNDSSN